MARFRAYERARVACEEAGECTFDDQEYYSFSTLLTKNGEHTWGVDIKTYLNDRDNWLNVWLPWMYSSLAWFPQVFGWAQGQLWEDHSCLDWTAFLWLWYGSWGLEWEPPSAQVFEEGGWGFDCMLLIEWNEENSLLFLIWLVSRRSMFRLLLRLILWFLLFIPRLVLLADCSIRTLVCFQWLLWCVDREWCSEEHPILRTHYRTYTIPEYQDFFKAYLIEESWWSVLDFGMPCAV